MEQPAAIDERVLEGLRALVDGTRLRIVARLATRPADAETLARELRIPVTAVRRNLDPLVATGLVERRDDAAGTLSARLDRVGDLGKALAGLVPDGSRGEGGGTPGSEASWPGPWPHEGEPPAETLGRMAATLDERKVVHAYLGGGRLSTIPAQQRKRLIVLRFLLERVFTEDRGYPEKEVNQRLALFHADVASLRRYLVDEGLVDREAGVYRPRREPRPKTSPS